MSSDAATNEQPRDDLAGKLERTELQHVSSSIPGRDIVQVLTEIPAGVESGWHQHPGEEVGYIVAGTVERAGPRARDRPHALDPHRRGRPADRRVHPREL